MTELEAGIIVRDAVAAAAFYGAAMGFTVEHDLSFPEGRVIRMRRGAARIKLYEPADATAAGRPLHSWRGALGFAYAALHVDDIAAAVDRAVTAGASVLVPVRNHRPDAWFALIADPSGNVWEMLQESPS